MSPFERVGREGMPIKNPTLLVDAAVNLVLGILLLAFNPGLADFLGVPPSSTNFYPSILGAVFVGITVALVVEAMRSSGEGSAGLGLLGAVCINLCGGFVLALWLLFGRLDIPMHGAVFLWALAAILVVLSSVELLRARRRTRKNI
jgi:hypothetical protein